MNGKQIRMVVYGKAFERHPSSQAAILTCTVNLGEERGCRDTHLERKSPTW